MLLRCESLEPPISQLGQTEKNSPEHISSALPPIATLERTWRDRQLRAKALNRCAIARCGGRLVCEHGNQDGDRR